MQKLNNIKFNNVSDQAMAFLMDPRPEWENDDDCIAFPCTAPSNIVMRFLNTVFSGQM
jgi:hypothetical protein